MINKRFIKLLAKASASAILTLSLVACSFTQASPDNDTYPYPIAPEGLDSTNLKFKLLDSVALKSVKTNMLPTVELSGLALDKDENILYSISDEGVLYHLKLTVKNKKIDKLKVSYATRLKDKKGRPLRKGLKDSEGLSLINANNGKKGDTKLIISFEGKPRVARFTTKGFLLADLALPKKISNLANYRKPNKSLESVVNHSKYGVLTASEYPLKHNKKKAQSVYATSKFSTTKAWHFPASKAKNSAITDMEVLPNGDLLILERAYSNPFNPIVINLSQLKLNSCNKKQHCKIENIFSLSSADGWRLDNFEGLSHIKDKQYLMVSDNNKNPLQETLFVLFEMK